MCDRKTTAKYTNRPSPPFGAAECPGEVKKGNDGRMYKSVKHGGMLHYAWRPVESAAKSPAKRSASKKASPAKRSAGKKASASPAKRSASKRSASKKTYKSPDKLDAEWFSYVPSDVPSDDTTFEIFVFKVGRKDGEYPQIKVTRADTVEETKKKIARKLGIPAREQYIVFRNTTLQDHHTLAEYNVLPDSTLHVLLRDQHAAWEAKRSAFLLASKSPAKRSSKSPAKSPNAKFTDFKASMRLKFEPFDADEPAAMPSAAKADAWLRKGAIFSQFVRDLFDDVGSCTHARLSSGAVSFNIRVSKPVTAAGLKRQMKSYEDAVGDMFSDSYVLNGMMLTFDPSSIKLAPMK